MRIALLEDDKDTAEIATEWLLQAGFSVSHFTSGLACARAVEEKPYDLCLFDWMVADMEGVDVLARLRIKLKDKLPPVIFITGRDSDEDMARVLSAGADDYVVKPVSRPVLLARINAVLRRAGVLARSPALQSFGPLSINYEHQEILLDGRRVDLTEREAQLAFYIFQNMGSLLSREHLIQVVWGLNAGIDTRTVDVHISALRRKLRLTAETGWKLVSVYRHGYRLERQESTL